MLVGGIKGAAGGESYMSSINQLIEEREKLRAEIARGWFVAQDLAWAHYGAGYTIAPRDAAYIAHCNPANDERIIAAFKKMRRLIEWYAEGNDPDERLRAQAVLAKLGRDE
jgi:hypothetical protein